MSRVVPGLCVLVLGCATSESAKKESVDAVFAPPPQSNAPAAKRAPQKSPESWARAFRRPGECEAAARDLGTQYGADFGWTYVKACIARPDFGLLETLIQNWPQDLKNRAESPQLLAQVIANRGGSVGPDLALLQQRRLALFELGAALRQPDAFKGRYLVFVGKVEKLRSAKGRSELVVLEQSRGSDQTAVFSGKMRGSVSASSSRSSGSGRFATSGVLGSGSGSYTSSGSSSGASMSGDMEQRVSYEFSETGQEVFVRLAQPDPFLSVDRNFVFLVRFDATKKSDVDGSSDEDPAMTALVTLVSYHDVNAEGVISR